MTAREPIGTPLREAATIMFLGSLLGSIVFAVVAAVGFSMSGPLAVSEMVFGTVVFASVAGLSTVMMFLPLGIILIVLLRRANVGRVTSAAACALLGGLCTLCFYSLLADSGMIGVLIPAPAVQGAATAFIYMRFSDA